ncbi:MAG: TIM barrel protein [Flavobacteriaceae bacterium]|jgi:hydroxypyruvate isomerase|nr:TIM barrel protein [Flavobacteriaceae bacterium]MDA7566684.1 TIM barrel protein [Flavobacteriaceae bacterium]MDB2568116.1 TIM barrel protein [Flavobacteriaceae bacterium]MDB4601147.1 TIM barrel protein [Flavobacteriaceae bacterium]MDB9847367.1 TIM barrel protein [Flavobacteriaceae bacterium]
MKRRNFIQNSTLTAASLMAVNPLFSNNNSNPNHVYNLNYAPHFGMFKNHAGSDIFNQLEFIKDQGFKAFEDNGMKNRDAKTQEKIGNFLSNYNIKMGVFVAHKIYWNEPNLASGDLNKRSEFLNDISTSVEVAKRVNAKWMTVVPGHLDLRKDMNYQTQNVIETLKQASEILEKHDLTMVLEPLNFRDHPGLFLTESPQAFQICKAVNSKSCKILFDIYHQQIQEGNLIPNIEASWNEIAYFQIGDNPGRNEPTTGEINYKNIFKYIYDKGFNGVLGMEHGNSLKGLEGELKLINSYKKVDNFK